MKFKQKSLKRGIATILALVLILGMLPITVFAASDDTIVVAHIVEIDGKLVRFEIKDLENDLFNGDGKLFDLYMSGKIVGFVFGEKDDPDSEIYVDEEAVTSAIVDAQDQAKTLEEIKKDAYAVTAPVTNPTSGEVVEIFKPQVSESGEVAIPVQPDVKLDETGKGSEIIALDKSGLTKQIGLAESLLAVTVAVEDDDEDVAVGTWLAPKAAIDALTTAIGAATVVVNDAEADEETVTGAIGTLGEAMETFKAARAKKVAAPVEPDVDTEAYDALVLEVTALAETDYTADSWALYQAAIAECDLTLTAEDGQDAIDAAVVDITAALALLVEAEKPVDPADAAIKAANDALAALQEIETVDEENYAAAVAAVKAAEDALLALVEAEVSEEDFDPETLQDEIDRVNTLIDGFVDDDPNLAAELAAIADAETALEDYAVYADAEAIEEEEIEAAQLVLDALEDAKVALNDIAEPSDEETVNGLLETLDKAITHLEALIDAATPENAELIKAAEDALATIADFEITEESEIGEDEELYNAVLDAITAAEDALGDLEALESEDEIILGLIEALEEAIADATEYLDTYTEPVIPITIESAAFSADGKVLTITLSDTPETDLALSNFSIAGAANVIYIGVPKLDLVNDSTEPDLQEKMYKNFTIAKSQTDAKIYTVTFKNAVANKLELTVNISGIGADAAGESVAVTRKTAGQQAVDLAAELITANGAITITSAPTGDTVKVAVNAIVTATIGVLHPSATPWNNGSGTTAVLKQGTTSTWTITFKANSTNETATVEVEVHQAKLALTTGTYTITEASPTGTNVNYSNGVITLAEGDPITLDASKDAKVISLLDALGTGNSFTVSGGVITAIALKTGTIDLSLVDLATLGLGETNTDIIIVSGVTQVKLPKSVTAYKFDFASSSNPGTGIGNKADITITPTNPDATVAMPATMTPFQDALYTVGFENGEVFTITTVANGTTFTVDFNDVGSLNFQAFLDGVPYPSFIKAVEAITDSTETITLATQFTLGRSIDLKGVKLDIINNGSLAETVAYRVTGLGSTAIGVGARLDKANGPTDVIKTWYQSVDTAIDAASAGTDTILVINNATVAVLANRTVDAGKLVVSQGKTLTIGPAEGTYKLTVSMGKLELLDGSEIKLNGDLELPELWGDLDGAGGSSETGWLGIFTATDSSKITFAKTTADLKVGSSNHITLTATTLSSPTSQTITVTGLTFTDEPSNPIITATAGAANAQAVLTLTGSTNYYGIGDDDSLTVGSNVELVIGSGGALKVDGELIIDGGSVKEDTGTLTGGGGGSDGTLIVKGAGSQYKVSSSVIVGSTGTIRLASDAVVTATILGTTIGNGEQITDFVVETGSVTIATAWDFINDHTLTLMEGTELNINGSVYIGGELVIEEGATLNVNDQLQLGQYASVECNGGNINITGTLGIIAAADLDGAMARFEGTGGKLTISGEDAEVVVNSAKGAPYAWIISRTGTTPMITTERQTKIEVDFLEEGTIYTITGGMAEISGSVNKWTVAVNETLIIGNGGAVELKKDATNALEIRGNVIVENGGLLRANQGSTSGITLNPINNEEGRPAKLTVQSGGRLEVEDLNAINTASGKEAIVQLDVGAIVKIKTDAAGKLVYTLTEVGDTNSFLADTQTTVSTQAGQYKYTTSSSLNKFLKQVIS